MGIEWFFACLRVCGGNFLLLSLVFANVPLQGVYLSRGADSKRGLCLLFHLLHRRNLTVITQMCTALRRQKRAQCGDSENEHSVVTAMVLI